MNVAHLLETSARREPGRTALVFGDRRLTYAELDREAGRVAAGLARLGIRRGERVCLHLANRPEFVVAYYGCQKLGRDAGSRWPWNSLSALPKSPTGNLKKNLR